MREIVTITVLILALITIATTTAAATPCDCGDICVNASGWWRDGGALNASTTPIQAGVDNATAGETIFVWNGSYTENVDIETSHLTLVGEGADVVTVTTASDLDHVFMVTASYVNVSGFSISVLSVTATDWSTKSGIYLNGVDHCNILGNVVLHHRDGIRLDSSSNNTLLNNTASGRSGLSRYGICMMSSSNNTLSGNIVSGNAHGIRMESSSNNMLANNTANSNRRYGIHMESSSNNTLLNNTASGNDYYGIGLFSSSDNNTLTGNIASNNDYYNIYLWSSENNTIYHNNLANGGYNDAYDECSNIWDNGAEGNYYSNYAGTDADGDGIGDTTYPIPGGGSVDNYPLMQPWGGGRVHNHNTGEDFLGIQSAIDDSDTLDEHTIIIDAGSYTENVNVNKRLTLAGAGAGVVTVNAASSNDHVFKATVDYVNISGFTVTGATGDYKAGIYLNDADHCNISDNNASNNYYGIQLTSSSSNTLTENTANSNTKRGICLRDSSDNNITCNWVQNNRVNGLRLFYGSTGNTIESNNIIANGNYNDTSGGYEWQFYNDQSDDVNTAGNWWGTNNETKIDASIYDWTYDAGWGNVTTNPKLDGAVPCAPIPELPTAMLFAVGLLMLGGYVRIGRKT